MKCCRCDSSKLRRDQYGNYYCRQEFGPCGHFWRYANNRPHHMSGEKGNGTKEHPWFQATVTTPQGYEHYFHSPENSNRLNVVVKIVKPKGRGKLHPEVAR
jgi:hypothetical protein